MSSPVLASRFVWKKVVFCFLDAIRMPVFDLREYTVERTTTKSNILFNKPFKLGFLSLRDTKVVLCHEINLVFLKRLKNHFGLPLHMLQSKLENFNE